MTGALRAALVGGLLAAAGAGDAQAQEFTYRGFAELRGIAFPQTTASDTERFIADALVRAEAFYDPLEWLQVTVGLDARANSHDQVAHAWTLDVADRGTRRPALSVRRAAASVRRGVLTLDVGKQFVRWGKADVLTPTDRFAARDFLNVVDNEFLPVRAVRAVVERNVTTLDVVWAPWLTPSRLPLLDQRWATVPEGITPVDATTTFPERSQVGLRLGYTGSRVEVSGSFFDGLNHLPLLDFVPGTPVFVRRYPHLRMYGADVAVPTRWLTLKGEIGVFTSNDATADDYSLYVVQVERQTGEWLLVGGYAGEVIGNRRGGAAFAPDRGLARSLVGRASYTIGPTRSAAIEGAVRQNGQGSFVRGELSQARGQHWRVTLAGALIRGEPDDFLGQFRRNSHVSLALRYSF